ncbi:MAG: sulfite exporter TauE/SafE family protein [Endomicrobiaceae bacterium]|nr:sulfite exporter TauE/SafE family protein [Endomicrobiaceae bacterium]
MDIISVIYCILIGLLAGSLSGLAGIGGGVVMVPLLVLFFGMTQHSAQGTALAVLPASILTIWIYYKAGNVNIPVALIICCGFIIGGYFGAKFATVLPANILRKIFSIIMLIVAVRMFFSK